MKDKMRALMLCAGGVAALVCLRAAGGDLPAVWTLPGGVYVDSCPAIDTNGTIYVTATGSTKY